MNDIVELPTDTTAVALKQDSPLQLAMQAMKAGMSVEDMRDMLRLQREWEAGEARKAYVKAMADFKRSAPEIFKDKQVAFSGTAYKHASLGNVVEKIVNGLAEHGISHRWDTQQLEGKKIIVTCILTHELGHSEQTSLEAQPDDSGKKNAIQQMGSTVSYLQRYTILMLSGLATKDQDDDGAAYGDPPGTSELIPMWQERIGGLATHESWEAAKAQAFDDFAEDPTGWKVIKGLLVARQAVIKAQQPKDAE